VEERKAKIRTFLGKHLGDHAVADDEDIFALGFVNSLMAMQLVTFIEKAFSVEIDDADLDLDNFRTLDAMDALVDRKIGSEK
jgi:methoxymalonate biosynthesis acyl carrier protein